MAIQPQTTGNEILDGIHELLAGGRIMSPSDPRIVRLSDEIDQLEKADETQHLSLRAMLLHLLGQTDTALQTLGNDVASDDIRLVILSNHGRCVEALKVFRDVAKPERGMFSVAARFAAAIGAFSQAGHYGRQAERMKMTNLESVPLEKIYMVEHFLNRFHISDEQMSAAMGAAGSVLLEHGLMFLGDAPNLDVIDIPGELSTIHVTYRVAATPAKTADLYMDFVRRVTDKDLVIPDGLHISFAGCPA